MEIRVEGMLTNEQRSKMLEQIMSVLQIPSQAEFARRCGISIQNINGWIKRGTYNVELLAVRFPELNGDWLLTGEGPILKADRDARHEQAPPQVTEVQPGDFRRAIDAIAAEQKLTAKAQEQADKILSIMQSLAASYKRLSEG